MKALPIAMLATGLSLLAGCDSENGRPEAPAGKQNPDVSAHENLPPPEKAMEADAASRMAGLRWPLRDTVGVNSPGIEQKIEERNFSEAKALLDAKIGGLKWDDALPAITEAGALPGPVRANLLAARDSAYGYALRWILTGDAEDARKAKEILLRTADTVSNWPLYDRKDQPQSQSNRSYLQDPEASGIWGGWHPLDLGDSIPLLRAYDILRPTLSNAERDQIEGKLLIFHKRLLEQFTGQMPRYTNLAGHHIMALARFGQVLAKPEYVHEAVRYWREILDYSYAPDGFFREVSPSYHNQITNRLIDKFPAMLKGYSDPAGFSDPISGQRFDQLDLAEEKKAAFRRMQAGLNVLVLPDRSYACLNDAWPKKMKAEAGTDLQAPGLLGVSGVAKLAGGGMAVLLKFGGIRGHDHRDALNLLWFAGGREVFSETSYREQSSQGIKFDREWAASTSSHMTAAIDEGRHFEGRTDMEVPDPIPRSAYVSRPPAAPGTHPVEAALPVASRWKDQGRLILWDASRPDAQAMEAEQENAYAGKASMFRRTVVMVPLGDGQGYLVDIFRIHGGTLHDYFLRGGLDEAYTLEFDQPLQTASGTRYGHIQMQQSGPVQPPLVGRAQYPGGFQVTSLLAGVLGKEPIPLQAALGNAPAIRRSGTAPFSFIRASSAKEGLETCWVWIHEASTGAPAIRGVTLSHNGMDVTVTVDLGKRRDRVFSGTSTDSKFAQDGWNFTGRLAFASERDGVRSGAVFSGSDLSHGEQIAFGKQQLEGIVLSTTRLDDGSASDSLLMQPDAPFEAAGAFQLAHIDFGDAIRFSIPIKSVTAEEGKLRVELSHSPGFIRDENSAIMTNSPGWRVRGETRVLLE